MPDATVLVRPGVASPPDLHFFLVPAHSVADSAGICGLHDQFPHRQVPCRVVTLAGAIGPKAGLDWPPIRCGVQTIAVHDADDAFPETSIRSVHFRIQHLVIRRPSIFPCAMFRHNPSLVLGRIRPSKSACLSGLLTSSGCDQNPRPLGRVVLITPRNLNEVERGRYSAIARFSGQDPVC